jgi:hypothetical protein
VRANAQISDVRKLRDIREATFAINKITLALTNAKLNRNVKDFVLKFLAIAKQKNITVITSTSAHKSAPIVNKDAIYLSLNNIISMPVIA